MYQLRDTKDLINICKNKTNERLEKELATRIDEAFEIPSFSDLPINVVHRIISKSKQYCPMKLLEFIKRNYSKFYLLISLIKFDEMPPELQRDFIEDIRDSYNDEDLPEYFKFLKIYHENCDAKIEELLLESKARNQNNQKNAPNSVDLIEKLQNELNIERQNKEEHKNKCKDLIAKFSIIERENEDLHRKMAMQSQNIEHYRNECQDLKAKLSVKERENENLMQKLKNSQNPNTQLQLELQNEKEENQRLRMIIQRLKRKIDFDPFNFPFPF